MNERYNLVQNVFILLWNAPFFFQIWILRLIFWICFLTVWESCRNEQRKDFDWITDSREGDRDWNGFSFEEKSRGSRAEPPSWKLGRVAFRIRKWDMGLRNIKFCVEAQSIRNFGFKVHKHKTDDQNKDIHWKTKHRTKSYVNNSVAHCWLFIWESEKGKVITLYSPLYCRSRSNVQAKVMSHSSESIVNPSKGIYVEMEGIMEVRNTQTSHQARSSSYSFPNFISFALEGALCLWLSRPLEQSRDRGLQIFPGESQVGFAFQ